MTLKSTQITKGFALALAASTGMAAAGGLDRSGQSTSILFESGSYVKLSFGFVTPSVSGIDGALMDTGNMAPAYVLPSIAVKAEITDKLSFAVIYDRPYGVNVDYTAGFFTDTFANVQSDALTALIKYNISDRVSIFGGASYQTLSADVDVPRVINYDLEMSKEGGFGYVAGAAYEIPEMALRVALTYRSEITTTHDAAENAGALNGPMDITTPKSVNLDFQTGINPTTLVFGSIRWVNWAAFDVTPPSYPLGSLVDYDYDVITYSLGVGRKLSDTLSIAATIGYERATGGDPTPLTTTDGKVSLGLGATYTMGNTEITAGVRKVWLGDSTGPAGSWTGNSAIAAGISFGYNF